MQITSQKYSRHNNLPCTVLKEAQQRSDYHTCRRDVLTSHKQTLDLRPSQQLTLHSTQRTTYHAQYSKKLNKDPIIIHAGEMS